MARELLIFGVLIFGHVAQIPSWAAGEEIHAEFMSRKDREFLKEEARDMFYHAYNAYMDNAYPADELMPLSCKGRYRGSEPDRGDIDSTLGNFSLTLVDSLDTLVVLGDLGEFENAVRLIVKDVTFDTDVIVSLFETNIRILGGLLSGHILAEYLQIRADIMPWYRGELLAMAKDLGFRFLPAFNTTTGIPYGRINLQNGMKGVPAEMCRETCTACAGSMILEMATLSRLTGESIFEDKAQKAMDALWKMRHRGTDLMGSVLNVHSGDWVRRDSGVGAGIDSYYEYCLKAYILLGDEKYLGRFNRHYQAVMKYVSQGPMLLDVHMHRPNTNSKNFMDALLAFWPGLQVLKGDIKPAVETHEMLYQVLQRHNFIPEAFTTDFQVHWGHHPLRPEFLESTYFLYRATGDHYYLNVGRKVLKSLQTYARVPCGYAAVSDVRTNKHDDTMESFVLSETFKYLFLLFAEPSELVLDLDEFIFTTEGHLLPLSLAAVRTNVSAHIDVDAVEVEELDRTCPNSLHLFPASVRQPLRNMVEDVCPRRTSKRRLSVAQFSVNNLEHLKLLSNMGITTLSSADGRIQLLHTFSSAKTVQDAEEGLMFMQEMVEWSKKQSQHPETMPVTVKLYKKEGEKYKTLTLMGGPAQFGPQLRGSTVVSGKPVLTIPSEGCEPLKNANIIKGKIALVSRGDCMFVQKARYIQEAGAIAGIVLDTTSGSSYLSSSMFAMSGDGNAHEDIKIPLVFLFNEQAGELIRSIADGPTAIEIGDAEYTEVQLKSPDDDQSMFERIKSSVKEFLSRPTSTQNSLTDSQNPTSIIPKAKTEEETPPDVEEFVIEHGNLRAVVPKNLLSEETDWEQTTAVVKLTAITLSEVPGVAKKLVPENDSLPFDKFWRTVKQILVNQIYSKTSKPPIKVIPLTQIKTYHEWRQMGDKQQIDESEQKQDFTVHELIHWFLNELADIEPKLEVFDPFSRLPPYLARRLKSRLLEVNQNSEEKEALIQMIDSYNLYDNFLNNVQDALEVLKTKFQKVPKGETEKKGEDQESYDAGLLLKKFVEKLQSLPVQVDEDKLIRELKSDREFKSHPSTSGEVPEILQNQQVRVTEIKEIQEPDSDRKFTIDRSGPNGVFEVLQNQQVRVIEDREIQKPDSNSDESSPLKEVTGKIVDEL